MDWDDSPWQAVVSAALVGTERQPFKPPMGDGGLGQLLAHLGDTTEAALLSTAGTLALYRRAGWLPETQPVSSVEPCPHDIPRCSARATQLLQQMIQGQYPQVLPEWLAGAAIAGQRVPETCLPELLDLGQRQRDLRAAILPVLGQRGRWLAAQNPDWSYAVTEDWEGNQAARLWYLQHLRSQNPDGGRELLETSWSQEAASDRAKFLETLRTGLSMADEPFLEAALSDRSREVRRVAADLLASLTDSRLCQQMVKQQRYLTLVPGQPPSLNVELPTALDADMLHYGIELKPANQLPALGEKAWWLLQMLGATPLDFWSNIWSMTPRAIVKCAQNHEWEAVLLNGWALAAKRQQHSVWIEALLEVWVTDKGTPTTLPELSLDVLLRILPPERQDAFLVNFLQSGRGAIYDSLTIWLLRHSSSQWSTELTQIVLTSLAHFMQNSNPTNSDWELRTALKEFARFIPITLISEAMMPTLPTQSPWISSIEEFRSLLQFRQSVAKAFIQT